MYSRRRKRDPVVPEPPPPAHFKEGDAVSTRFRGAFCSAKIKSVKMSLVITVEADDKEIGVFDTEERYVKGKVYEVGTRVSARSVLHTEYHEGRITRVKDNCLYEVIFSDGETAVITERAKINPIGRKHFQQTDSLDAFPLFDPKSFACPVVEPRQPTPAALKPRQSEPTRQKKTKRVKGPGRPRKLRRRQATETITQPPEEVPKGDAANSVSDVDKFESNEPKPRSVIAGVEENASSLIDDNSTEISRQSLDLVVDSKQNSSPSTAVAPSQNGTGNPLKDFEFIFNSTSSSEAYRQQSQTGNSSKDISGTLNSHSTSKTVTNGGISGTDNQLPICQEKIHCLCYQYMGGVYSQGYKDGYLQASPIPEPLEPEVPESFKLFAARTGMTSVHLRSLLEIQTSSSRIFDPPPLVPFQVVVNNFMEIKTRFAKLKEELSDMEIIGERLMAGLSRGITTEVESSEPICREEVVAEIGNEVPPTSDEYSVRTEVNNSGILAMESPSREDSRSPGALIIDEGPQVNEDDSVDEPDTVEILGAKMSEMSTDKPSMIEPLPGSSKSFTEQHQVAQDESAPGKLKVEELATIANKLVKRGRGRPTGWKKKQQIGQLGETSKAVVVQGDKEPKKRGRPKGSKNKAKAEPKLQSDGSSKPPVGKAKGSRGKPPKVKLPKQLGKKSGVTAPEQNAGGKRKRGRPCKKPSESAKKVRFETGGDCEDTERRPTSSAMNLIVPTGEFVKAKAGSSKDMKIAESSEHASQDINVNEAKKAGQQDAMKEKEEEQLENDGDVEIKRRNAEDRAGGPADLAVNARENINRDRTDSSSDDGFEELVEADDH